MRRLTIAVLLMCVTSAHGSLLPDTWPPACQSITLRGPDADFHSRQRRKLAKCLLGYPTCPNGCHFVLIGTPEKPNPVYRARNLGLACQLRTGDWTLFPWPKHCAGE